MRAVRRRGGGGFHWVCSFLAMGGEGTRRDWGRCITEKKYICKPYYNEQKQYACIVLVTWIRMDVSLSII